MIRVVTTLDVPEWAPQPTASPSIVALEDRELEAGEREELERRRRRPFGFARALETEPPGSGGIL